MIDICPTRLASGNVDSAVSNAATRPSALSTELYAACGRLPDGRGGETANGSPPLSAAPRTWISPRRSARYVLDRYASQVTVAPSALTLGRLATSPGGRSGRFSPPDGPL